MKVKEPGCEPEKDNLV